MAPNYGVAGAIDFFGPDYGLPSAISTHNNYWLWGPGDADGSVTLVIGASEDGLSQWCETYQYGATIDCGYCMPYENNNPIWICRNLRMPVTELWAAMKNYN